MPLSFSEYQRRAQATDQSLTADLKSIGIPLLGLAGEVGSLLTEYKKYWREGERYRPFADQVAEEIGDVLWYLSNLAQKAGLDLEDIALENLAKVRERWPTVAADQQLLALDRRRYDSAFPPNERLPMELRAEFREYAVGSSVKVEISIDGNRLGDHLTDNAHADDGYRFHDVFHLTNGMMLGWSPVLRSLLSTKRKSSATIDEVEDGARAAVTEEAISAMIFGHARDHSYFDGVLSVDYELLKTAKLLTRNFEVRDRTLREWERSILEGYSVWRAMRENRGGVFVGNASTGTVGYEALS